MSPIDSPATWAVQAADDGAVAQLAERTELPRAVVRTLYLRGYRTTEMIQRFLADREVAGFLETPLATPEVEKAVRRVRQAIDRQEPMVIYGDYDCDGVTSSTVLYRYLRNGLKANVRAYLPDRFRDGFGVTPAAVERLAKEGVKLILTCDNGISAHLAAQQAKEHGVDLIITDHHQVPDELPEAHAIVHPKVDFAELGLHDLAGVGVAYMFLLAMEGGMTSRMEFFLDAVAIGTIADVVPLNGPNRPLVWAGLERIRDAGGKKRNLGIDALFAVADRDPRQVTARDVGFALAPRINAAGRLETPDLGFKLLTAASEAEARHYAQELDAINRDRRELSAELEAEVYDHIERTVDLDREPFVVLHDEGFHHGITGIVAGRIKERYRVPVILFSSVHDGTVLKGSGRSPEGCHLYEALHACGDLLANYGGHAQAAGCAVDAGNLDALREGLNAHLDRIGWRRKGDEVMLDSLLPFREADGKLIEALKLLEPCGQKNPAPQFGLLHARVVSKRAFGPDKRHLELHLDDGETVGRVIHWNGAEKIGELCDWVHLRYEVRPNFYQGRHELQFIAGRIEPATAPPRDRVVVEQVSEVRIEAVPAVPRKTARLVDRRGEDPRLLVLKDFREGDGLYLGGCLHAAGNKAITRFIEANEVPLLDAANLPVSRLVCLDVPRDEATWERLRFAAPELVLAWETSIDEPLLDEPTLQAVYRALFANPGIPLDRVPLPPEVAGRQARDAWAILEEARVLLVMPDGRWRLLAAEPACIPLGDLAAFRRHRGDREFRNTLSGARELLSV